MRFALISLFLLSSFSFSFAQPYQGSIGARTGSATGLSLKQFVAEYSAVEGLLVWRRDGIRLIGLFEQHLVLTRDGSSLLYGGIGGHVGWTGLISDTNIPQRAYGVDFVLGLSYVFPRSPITLSVDVKPMFELYRGNRFSGNNAGVTLRYTW
ncbi:MAG: hypothetical protein AAFR61_12995 [Bacteroidota bacterium]